MAGSDAEATFVVMKPLPLPVALFLAGCAACCRLSRAFAGRRADPDANAPRYRKADTDGDGRISPGGVPRQRAGKEKLCGRW